MRVVRGNKKINLTPKEFAELSRGFGKTIVDLGTGDGRFVYKKALENPDTLYIGVDPSAKQLEIYSRKAVRKKLGNVLFVVGSIERLPSELAGTADKVHITLPWGTLLQSIVKPTKESVCTLRSLLKSGGSIEMILGYTQENEPTETTRLELPEIDEQLITQTIVPVFEENGFILKSYNRLGREELKQFETSWSKKLGFGKSRPLFHVIFEV